MDRSAGIFREGDNIFKARTWRFFKHYEGHGNVSVIAGDAKTRDEIEEI
jgi:hypothetical protein